LKTDKSPEDNCSFKLFSGLFNNLINQKVMFAGRIYVFILLNLN